MTQKFLILGLPPGGLFVARQLRRMWPDSIIYAIGDSDHDIGRYSNTIDKFYNANSSDTIFAKIQLAYKDLGGGEIKAFMCSNPMLEFIVGEHPEVFNFLEFENGLNVYKVLVDKKQVDALCSRLSIAMPKEYSLCDSSIADILYPAVVKPLEKKSTLGAGKCEFIDNEVQLSRYLSRMDEMSIDRSNLICQQRVQGDNRWEYGYGGYFVRGVSSVDICFHQFIQVPQGLCCYSREVTDKSLEQQIKKLVEPILKETRYTGFIEFDIKQDSNTKELFLLDINPRPWRSVDMLGAKLGSSTVFQPEVANCRVVWRYPYRELLRKKNPNNVSYGICKCLSNSSEQSITKITIFDKKDKGPCFHQMWVDVKEAFGKIIGSGR